MKLVVDASVTLKWFISDDAEQDVVRARELLDALVKREAEFVQPPHWISEVLAVTSRLRPDLVADTLAALRSLEPTVVESDAIYVRAGELAHRLKQHLFDTLYHAVALESGGTLVTADERYYSAAMHETGIIRLQSVAQPFLGIGG